ncbi:SGNH/GDSL hydrolase family protein [Candidatus Omnitrophota bacterium]
MLLISIEVYFFYKYKDTQVGGITSPSHYTFYKKYYHYNSLGFRDKERTYGNNNNAYRILAIGDSYTFGAGVKYKEELYTYILENRLNESNILGSRLVEVINTGKKGLNTKQEFAYLRNKGILFSPDMIILGYVLNDATTDELKQKMARNNQEWQLLPPPFGKFLNAYSFTYYFLRKRLKSTFYDKASSVSRKKPYFINLYSEENTKKHREIFVEFLKFCEVHGIKVFIVLFPQMYHIRDEVYPYNDEHKYVETIADEHSVPLVDLLKDLQNSDFETFTVSSTDAHPNEHVHRLAANVIYNKIVNEKLINSSKSYVR